MGEVWDVFSEYLDDNRAIIILQNCTLLWRTVCFTREKLDTHGCVLSSGDTNASAFSIYNADWTLVLTGLLIENVSFMKAALYVIYIMLKIISIISMSESRTPLVTTFNKTNPVLMGLVHKYWPILQSTTRRAILFKTPPVRAYRWSENLQDILVRAKLKPLNTQQTNAFSMPSVLTHLFQSKRSEKLLDCGRKIRNDVHIDTHYCKPELKSWP